jgi:hypothetical protein
MKIYVDFDDCLCETAKSFSELVVGLFDIHVPYENMKYFNLQKTFSLTDDQYEHMMIEGHKPEVLLSYDETPGASTTINSWIDKGIDVSIITGRPASAYEPSRQWLDEHDLDRVNLFCLDKYGRDNFIKGSSFTLKLEDYYKMHFDYAVEDSPMAFGFFSHLPELKVLVYDRPWNRDCEFPEGDFRRCNDWETIRNIVG